jgi:hypothetical protein
MTKDSEWLDWFNWLNWLKRESSNVNWLIQILSIRSLL